MVKDWGMTSNEWRLFNKDKKMFKFYSENRYKCTCSHTVIIKPNETRVLCNYCGRWVYKDKKEMFKDRLRSKLNENIIK